MKILESSLVAKSTSLFVAVLLAVPSFGFAIEPTDTTKPVITLKGEAFVILERFSTFSDPGVNAVDNESGIASITTIGEVDSAVPGTLNIIKYTATDNAGNSASITRTVSIVDTTSPNKVTNLTIQPGLNSVVLTWNLPTDKDFAYLNVYRSEVPGELGKLLLTKFKSNKVTDSGLVSGKAYYYSIESVDDQGLTSPIIGISATTLTATSSSNNTNVSQSVSDTTALNNVSDIVTVTPENITESQNQEVLGSTTDNTENSKENLLSKKVLGMKVWAWGAILLISGLLGTYYFVRKFLKITR